MRRKPASHSLSLVFMDSGFRRNDNEGMICDSNLENCSDLAGVAERLAVLVFLHQLREPGGAHESQAAGIPVLGSAMI